MKPSKLWRKLGVTEPVFRIFRNRDGWNVYDDRIVSMTLTRGSGNVVGVATNTLQVTLAGAEPPTYADAIKIDVNLTAAGRDALIAKCDNWAGTGYARPVEQRWQGRIAGQSVADSGDLREPLWTTEITGSDLTPLIDAIGGGAAVTSSDTKVSSLVRSMVTRSGLTSTSLTILGGVYLDVLDPTKTYDVGTVTGHWIKDLGALLRTSRSGGMDLLNNAYFQYVTGYEDLGNWRTVAPYPITRASCIGPVSWDQRITMPYGVRWTTADGTTWDVHIGSNNPDVGKWPTETLDMKDVKFNPDIPDLYDAMTARVYRSARSGYVVSGLKFDILDLINRPSPNERRLAMLLLTLEPGDPIAIAKDWPAVTVGLQIATRITETITPNEWTLTLDVVPAQWATGLHSAPAPDYTAWDYAFDRGATWDGIPEAIKWNEAP